MFNLSGVLFSEGSSVSRDRPVLTHSFPTRRSSDLRTVDVGARHADRAVPGRKQHIRPDSSEQSNLEQRLAKLDPALRPEDALEPRQRLRSEEHRFELQSLIRISYAVFCLTQKSTVSCYILPTLAIINYTCIT